MDPVELLAVRGQADCAVLPVQLGYFWLDAQSGQLDVPQDAVAGYDEAGFADLVADPFERLLQIGKEIAAVGHPQNDALIDGTVEGETAVRVRPLDGTSVVAPADADHHGVCREQGGLELVWRNSDKPRVFLGGGESIDSHHPPCRRICPGHHHPPFGAHEWMGGEDREWQGCRSHHKHGAVFVECAVVEYEGMAKALPVSGRPTHERHASQRMLEHSGHQLLTDRHAID